MARLRRPAAAAVSPLRMWQIVRGRGPSSRPAAAAAAGLDFSITSSLRLELGYQHRLDQGRRAHCLAGAAGGVFSAANCNGAVDNFVSSHRTLPATSASA